MSALALLAAAHPAAAAAFFASFFAFFIACGMKSHLSDSDSDVDAGRAGTITANQEGRVKRRREDDRKAEKKR